LGGSRFDPLFLVSLETSSICVVLELWLLVSVCDELRVWS
jgi:hypothetical protein